MAADGPPAGKRPQQSVNWSNLPKQITNKSNKQLSVFMVFSWFFMVFHGFFKELDFKELEIHRYSLLDIHQWIHWWISINEFIDGPSINSLTDIHQWIWSPPLVPFLWAPFLGPFPLGPMGQPLGPMASFALVVSSWSVRTDFKKLWEWQVQSGCWFLACWDLLLI